MTSPAVTRTMHESGDTGDRARPAVSLRDLHAALLAGSAGQLTNPHNARTSPPRRAVRRTRVDTIQTGDFVASGDSRTGRLSPRSTAPPDTARVTVVATHGGSGARSLAAVLTAAEVCRSWPIDAEANLASPVPVLLVCRSHAHGLTSAQRFAREYRDGDCPSGLFLLGCAVVADAPGRLPIALRRLQRLLAAAVPQLWPVPWVPAWRLAPPHAGQRPDWATRLCTELDSELDRAAGQ